MAQQSIHSEDANSSLGYERKHKMQKNISNLSSLISDYRNSVLVPTKEEPVKAPPFSMNKVTLSVSEAAAFTGLSVRSIERVLKRGEIRYKKVGRRVVIPVSSIEAWLNDEGSQ